MTPVKILTWTAICYNMKRPGDSLRKPDREKRPRLAAPGLAASSLVTGSSAPALAASYLSCLKPAALTHTTFDVNAFGALRNHVPRAYDGDSGRSTLQTGVLSALGETKIAAAFGRPFAGVAISSAVGEGMDMNKCTNSARANRSSLQTQKMRMRISVPILRPLTLAWLLVRRREKRIGHLLVNVLKIS